MIKLIKEDIEGIRYCVIKKIGDKFYDFVQFCDSSLNARKLAFQLAKSDDAEYWAFDTKKWKALIPPIKNSWKFNSNLPIYCTDDTSKAELLINYVNRVVNDTTGRWNESYKRLHEQDVEIEVKHEGILEVPKGKNVEDLPVSHFVNLAKKKGTGKITKALNNLQVWNKKKNPSLSKWAGDMIDKVNKKMGKKESYSWYDEYDEEDEIYFDDELSLSLTVLSDGKSLYGVNPKNFDINTQYDDYVLINTGDFDYQYADDSTMTSFFEICYDSLKPLLVKLNNDIKSGKYKNKYMQFTFSASVHAYIDGYSPITYSNNYGYQPEDPGNLDYDVTKIDIELYDSKEITEDVFLEDIEEYGFTPLFAQNNESLKIESYSYYDDLSELDDVTLAIVKKLDELDYYGIKPIQFGKDTLMSFSKNYFTDKVKSNGVTVDIYPLDGDVIVTEFIYDVDGEDLTDLCPVKKVRTVNDVIKIDRWAKNIREW